MSLTNSDKAILNPEEIKNNPGAEIFGKRGIYHYMVTDSTNDRAEELAGKGAPEGTVLIAESQTGGKGRTGRPWFSPEGCGIYMSLVLRPQLKPAEVQGVTIMTAVAAVEALLKIYRVDLEIKWPNDILIRGKKAAGILTTMNTVDMRTDYIITGIGINVNTPADLFPADIKDIATSLFAETGIKRSRVDIIKAFLLSFEKYYKHLISGELKIIIKEWKRYSNLAGRIVDIDMVNQTITGEVLDIDTEGYLIISDNMGKVHRVISGEVTRIH